MATIRLGGLATGLDTETLIQKILDVERIPIRHLQARKTILGVKNDALTAIKNSLSSLQTAISDLKTSAFFSSNAATSSDTTVATASADTTAARSNYSIIIDSVASASTLRSGTSLGPVAQKIARTIDSTATVGSNTSYGSSLTTGTFTVNGTQVTITTSSTLDSIIADIEAISGIDAANTKYDAATDKITIAASAGTVTLGSGTDTSNFLVRNRLFSNGTGTVTSLTTIGNIDTSKAISSADSRIGAYAALTSGTFTVNGVTITINKDTDTLQSVMDQITASSAGVYATYDSVEDRMVLTSKTTGSFGIGVANGTSNFASSMKLTSSTSQTSTGYDTVFYVNDAGKTNPHKSADSTLTETESGITGLTISALKAGTTNITVSVDTATIQSEITEFISQYNSVQNIISSYTNTPTEDTEPDDPASILAGDSSVASLAHDLRETVMSALSSGDVRMLEDIGVTASGDNNLLAFSDPADLTSALALHHSEVVSLFTDATDGIMIKLDDLIDAEDDATTGTLTVSIDGIADEETRIDDDISALERQISMQEERLVAAFAALEAYQATHANILSYLTGKTSSS